MASGSGSMWHAVLFFIRHVHTLQIGGVGCIGGNDDVGDAVLLTELEFSGPSSRVRPHVQFSKSIHGRLTGLVTQT